MINTQIKKHVVGALICMLLLGLVAFCGTTPVEATDTSSNMTITNNKMIALTFDDGPSEYTNRLLDILSENSAKATFFVTGSKIDSNQLVLAKALSQNCEIIGHTWSHSDLTGLSYNDIAQELTKTNIALYDTLGISPQMFRPPFGEISADVITVAEDLNFAIILWSISTLDWQTQNAGITYETIMNSVHDGAIILCHDTVESTIDAMGQAIPELISRGYTLVTVSELLGKTEAGQIYRNSISNWTGITHTVKQGESLWSISKIYSTTINAIKTLNGLTSDLIHPGQVLKIPEGTPVTPPSTDTSIDGLTVGYSPLVKIGSGNSGYGETTVFLTFKLTDGTQVVKEVFVTGIKWGVNSVEKVDYVIGEYEVDVTITIVTAGNNFNQLTISNVTATYIVSPVPSTFEGIVYTVKSGDTLWLISKAFGTTVDAIKTLNGLTSDMIYVGQTLMIPVDTPV